MRALAFAVAVMTTACYGNVQRSVRVPHPSVPLETGQPMDSAGELDIGMSSVADVMKPTVGNATQSVEIPSQQARSEIRLRAPGDHMQRLSLGLAYEHGFGSTAQKPDETQAPVPKGDVRGYGATLRYAADTDTPGFSIGLAAEVMMWSLPYIEYASGVVETGVFGDVDYMYIDSGRAHVPTLGLGFTPTYRRGDITLFGGVFCRNHPTTTRKQPDDFTGGSDDIRSGPINVLLHAGLAVAITKKVQALAIIHDDIVSDPVRYGPGVELGLGFKL